VNSIENSQILEKKTWKQFCLDLKKLKKILRVVRCLLSAVSTEAKAGKSTLSIRKKIKSEYLLITVTWSQCHKMIAP